LDNSDKTILVAGATGRQGCAVVRHLLKKNWSVKALTRNPESTSAKSLSNEGVEVIKGNMDDAESLTKVMTGVYGVFSVQDFWKSGAAGEIQQGKNMADAAKNCNVKHLVYSSVGGAERNSGIEHFESKFVVEKYIRSLKLPSTILRPVSFMENYYIPIVEKGILKGRLVDPILPDRNIQQIAADDIGAFASLAFEKPEEFLNIALEIAGDEFTNPEAADIFSRVLGRKVRYKKLPMFIVKYFMGKETYQMFSWFNSEGYKSDISYLRSNYPEVKLTSLEDWLLKEGWDKKTKYVRHEKSWDLKPPKSK
jgi:uncharacterized protein YbjT (DUF2867 family)